MNHDITNIDADALAIALDSTGPVTLAPEQAARLIEDEQLRDSTRALIETLLPAPDAQANTTARSNDQ